MRLAALRVQLAAGLLAGVAGGILFELAGVILDRRDAVTLLGPNGLGIVHSPVLGALLHFCVAIAWAFGYVYAVRSQPQLAQRPWISGAAYGLMVYVCMQIVLLTAGIYHRPGPQLLGTQLLAHIVFYGIPVALTVSHAARVFAARPTAR